MEYISVERKIKLDRQKLSELKTVRKSEKKKSVKRFDRRPTGSPVTLWYAARFDAQAREKITACVRRFIKSWSSMTVAGTSKQEQMFYSVSQKVGPKRRQPGAKQQVQN